MDEIPQPAFGENYSDQVKFRTMSQLIPSDGSTQGDRATIADRVIAVLEAIARYDMGVGVRELGRDTGIDKSAVSRLLLQLERLGMVQRVPSANGRYLVGERLFLLARTVAAKDSVLTAAKASLEHLVGEVDETCYLGILEGDALFFRYKVECKKPVRYVLDLHVPVSIHAGAGGRAVLAGLGPGSAREILSRIELPKLTEQTIVDVDDLIDTAIADHERGYSVSRGERIAGGSAVGAPFYSAAGECLGVVILAIPAERFDPHRSIELGEAVARAAHTISLRLGLTAYGDGNS